MFYDAIDSAYLAVPDLDTACQPYERLGLRLSPPHHGKSCLRVGMFALHFLSDDPLTKPVRHALVTGRSLFAVGLGVSDLNAITASMESKGLSPTRFDEGKAWLPLHDQAGSDLVLVQKAVEQQDGHAFPLKRLDHLAMVTHDLEVKTRFWQDILGIQVAGEIATPTMVIRQLRIGNAVLELLGPASEDSPLWQRPPGLVSMASWEVEELERAVRQARAVGFTVTEPAAGPLPGTRIATIQGTELAGINMQLLEYV